MSVSATCRRLEQIIRAETELSLNTQVNQLPAHDKEEVCWQVWNMRCPSIEFYGDIAFNECFGDERVQLSDKVKAVDRLVDKLVTQLMGNNPDESQKTLAFIAHHFRYDSWEEMSWKTIFAQLPTEDKVQIYYHLWELKNLGYVEKSGEKAFHKKDGFSSTKLEKAKAVERCLFAKAALPRFPELRMALESKNFYFAASLQSSLATNDKNKLFQEMYNIWENQYGSHPNQYHGEMLFTRLPREFAVTFEDKKNAINTVLHKNQDSLNTIIENKVAQLIPLCQNLDRARVTHIVNKIEKYENRECQDDPMICAQRQPRQWFKIDGQQGNIGDIYFIYQKGIFIVTKTLQEGGFKRPLVVIDYANVKEHVLLQSKDPHKTLRKEIENINTISRHEGIAECIWADTTIDMILQPKYHGSLSSILQFALSEMDKKQISEDSIAGLDYLHSKNIVHRDIKSANILVSQQNGRWRARITDFGSGIRMEERNIIPFEGTPLYLAPETFLHLLKPEKHCFPMQGRHADIFSMGVVWYEMWNNGQFPKWCKSIICHITSEVNNQNRIAFSNIPNLFRQVFGYSTPEERVCEQIGFTKILSNTSIIMRLISQMLLHNPNERPLTNKVIATLNTI